MASATGRLPAHVLPAPWAIGAAAWEKILDGQLVTNIAVSFRRAVSGFVVGGGIAFALGLANGLSKISEKLTDTTASVLPLSSVDTASLGLGTPGTLVAGTLSDAPPSTCSLL